MSRIEELRARLRAKVEIDTPDPQEKEFGSLLRKIVSDEKNASAHNSAYQRRMFGEYKENSSEDAESWIRSQLDRQFLSIKDSPVWNYEPSWCFDDGKPLTFMHQFADEHGRQFYVFRGEKEVEMHGIKANVNFYTMIWQDKNCESSFQEKMIY